ncbi:MAG: hypothetical protein ACREQ5_14815 [Candidatus Dormibacteria bacterium]
MSAPMCTHDRGLSIVADELGELARRVAELCAEVHALGAVVADAVVELRALRDALRCAQR